MEKKNNQHNSTKIPFSIIFLAQQGDKDALNYLWEQYKPFVHWFAGTWAPYSVKGKDRWYEYNDLTQTGYLAFRKALEKWKPVEGVEFKEYFRHWLKEFFRREVGISNSRRIEILKDTISLNQRSKESKTKLDHVIEEWIDFEEDPTALEAFEQIENFDFARTIREQVDKLNDPEKTVIKEHHFKGRMIKDIAAELGVSPTSTARYLENGYRILRTNEIIQVLYAEIRNPGPNPYEQIRLKAFKIDRMSAPEWDYVVKETFKEDLVRIFCGEEIDEMEY